MDNSTLWATILAVASAIVLLSNAAEKIIKAWKSAKAPHDELAGQVKALQEWKVEVDKRLDRGGQHFDAIDASNRVTQLALLALLDHGIDGNNLKQMEDAKSDIIKNLIKK